MLVTTETSLLICPTCGQRLPGKERRVCGVCQKPILRHEKYLFSGSQVQHRCCENPTSYTPKGEES